MFKTLVFILFFIAGQFLFAQNQQLAQEHFLKGQFEKAAHLYRELYDKNKHSIYYFQNLLKCYQAAEAFKKAEELIRERIKSFPTQHFLWVELGYNFDLQHEKEQAERYYKKAEKWLEQKPASGYFIAKSFHDNHLLDYALKAYQLMMKESPAINYNFQVASIYGEKGDIEKMFDLYFDIINKGGNVKFIQTSIGRFITDDPKDANNLLFKKLLIKRLQENPMDEWNKLLSWLYLQQKEYAKALVQEKAIHKRTFGNYDGIITVGMIAFDAEDYTTAKEAFHYVLNIVEDPRLQIEAQYYLLESDIGLRADTAVIEDAYRQVFNRYGTGNNTTKIQVSYANFLTFSLNQPQKAIDVLKKTLRNPLNKFQKAEVKIQVADIMVFTGKYNQALIYYSQVQSELKNHILAQEARFKVAQTSYFRGDFDWANIQLKVLKSSTSKLIANDALDLSLRIDDNIAQDSIKTALESYAAAELLAYQNKHKEAIDSLSHVLKIHKGHPIEDEALYKQAQLFETVQQYKAAEQNYLDILALNNDDILIDDAIYCLAKLYDTRLNDTEKAKEFYERILFEHPSSIYLVPARKRYRQLRGDMMEL